MSCSSKTALRTRRCVQASLNSGGTGAFVITHAERLAEGLEQLRHAQFDVLLLDLSLPDSAKSETSLRAQAEAPHLPIVVMTGVDDEAFALEAMRNGIQDYLVKGHAFGRQTSRAIRYAIERKRMEAELQQERDQLEERVRERTAELSATNRDLQSEIARRQQAEAAAKADLATAQRRGGDRTGPHLARTPRPVGPGTHGSETGARFASKTMFVLVELNTGRVSKARQGLSRGTPCANRAPGGRRALRRLKLGLQMLQGECPFAPELRQSVSKLMDLTTSLMREIHRLAWELHPAVLDDLGLDAALRRYTSDWSEANGVPVDWHSNGLEEDRLPLELESTLYRVTQEALTNVARHANAKRVSVLLERRPGQVSLILEDDGAGFDAAAAFHSFSATWQIGPPGNAGTRHPGRRRLGHRIHAGRGHHAFCARAAGSAKAAETGKP